MTTEPAKTDYKSTLCLPQTKFAMKANLYQREPEILERWRSENLQKKINEKPSPKGTFLLHDGPPYANGHIHLGHALNKILKDVVVRYHTMLGYNSPYVPGWDCHGLPIELKVVSDLGKKKSEKTALEIRQLCQDSALKWATLQSEEFQRLGIGGEWEKPYLTMDPKVEVGILRALRDLVSGGYVYKGLKPVYWCAYCVTALAEAEVEYDNHTSPSIYVKFPLLNPEQNEVTRDLQNPAIVIWTTTPWTLPANLAVSLHPDFEYVVLRTKGTDASPEEDWIVARELVESFAKAAGLADFKIVKKFQARDLENMEMEHPVQPDRTSRVILGTHVTLEQGTGAVHTAPGHGMEDFIVCQQYGIPTFVPVDAHGRFTADFSLMQGMAVWEANAPIIKYLDEKNLLIKASQIEHSYPHCWRCHNPVIYRATEQWFADVDHDSLRQKALDQIDHGIRWIPKWGHDRMYNMVAARPDWCLSRQRAWGVPIPALTCGGCGKGLLDARVIDRVCEVVADRGTNAWFEDDASTFIPGDFKCPDCGSGEFSKEMNILDVWFESGSTQIAVLEQRPELRWPADMYLEGSDQHRGWFQSSLLVAMGAKGAPPFRSVLTHGFVLDGKGEAMSKSKGNVISPEEIIKKLGADVLRLWVASEDYRGDVKVSNEILDRVGESYRRIRNTLRYLLGNLSDFSPETDTVAYDELPELDRWILHELFEFIETVRSAYENYEFHRIFHAANQFCVVQLSKIYVDVAKDRVYCSGVKSEPRKAAQTVQYAVFDALVRLLAPLLVFTCDEAYQHLDSARGSIHLLPFPEACSEWKQPELSTNWAKLLELRDDVMRALEDARQNLKQIGHPLEAHVKVVPATADLYDVYEKHLDQLADLFVTSGAEIRRDEPELSGAITAVRGERGLIAVFAAEGAKCERCWKILPSVGQDEKHHTLCDRCANVVRRYYE
jgi:isoleucyl-tRNA synthetase